MCTNHTCLQECTGPEVSDSEVPKDMLGAKLRSSARGGNALNLRASSSSGGFFFWGEGVRKSHNLADLKIRDLSAS